jgi:hypothetical protein
MISSVSSVNFEGTKKDKNAGVMPAVFTYAILGAGLRQVINPALHDKFQKISRSLSKDEVKSVLEAVDKAYETSGVKAKGVIIDRVSPKYKFDLNNFKEIYKKDYIKGIKELFIGVLKDTVKDGRNACYYPGEKKIIVPERKLSLANFHEIGHAMNFTLTKAGKCVLPIRKGVAAAGALTSLYAVCTKNKDEDNHKVHNFIRNNAGKLAVLALVPTVIEEATASHRGAKLAKNLLSPELFKKITKTHRFALGTYITMAVTAGLAAFAGVKVKDSLQARHDAKTKA